MTDDALDALRANDRPHSLPSESYQAIEQAMLDAYRSAEPESPSGPSTPYRDWPESEPDEPNKWGRAVWIGIAAGLVTIGLAAGQLIDNEEPAATAGSEVLGDYCQSYLEPLADALDLLRVNPNQPNAAEAHRLLGQALTQLEQSQPIVVESSDLTEDYNRLPATPDSSDMLIGIANTLGQRIASLTESSPRCNHQRLAPNLDRATRPNQTITTNDPQG